MSTSQIPFLDFGGAGPLLHFAHANAYPPECYRLFINELRPHYHVLAMKQRPLWPHTNPAELTSWQIFADDMVRFLVEQELENVIGVGHSLGGVATMLAAQQHPQLFRALVLIEPVFLPPHLLQMAAAQPHMAEKTPMVRNARHRRDHWHSRQEAFDRFRQKAVFARWSDAALWDYVNYGTHEHGNAVVLTYPRDWEAAIYAHLPTTVWEDIERITHPTLAICAAETDTIYPESWQLWQAKQPEATFIQIADADHMVPMQRPSYLAQTIHQFLQALADDNPDHK